MADKTPQRTSGHGPRASLVRSSNWRGLPLLLSSLPLIALLLGGSPAAAKSKCFPREGNCVQVSVNGQDATKLKKKERKALARYESASRYVLDVVSAVPSPVRGELEIVPSVTPGGEGWFGSDVKAQIGVVPLDEVSLEVEQRLATSSSVRIGGQAAVTQRLELQSNELPPGAYLLRVTLRGSENWDRATIFFQVE